MRNELTTELGVREFVQLAQERGFSFHQRSEWYAADVDTPCGCLVGGVLWTQGYFNGSADHVHYDIASYRDYLISHGVAVSLATLAGLSDGYDTAVAGEQKSTQLDSYPSTGTGDEYAEAFLLGVRLGYELLPQISSWRRKSWERVYLYEDNGGGLHLEWHGALYHGIEQVAGASFAEDARNIVLLDSEWNDNGQVRETIVGAPTIIDHHETRLLAWYTAADGVVIQNEQCVGYSGSIYLGLRDLVTT